MEERDFGWALRELKCGCRVARQGWNGKDMFLYHVPADKYPAQSKAIKGTFVADMVPCNCSVICIRAYEYPDSRRD